MSNILKIFVVSLWMSEISSAGFVHKIYYKDQNEKSIEVKSEASIPKCSNGEVRIKCEPSPYLAMLGPYVISYSKCYTKEDLESMSWYEKFKLCPFGRKSVKEHE